MATLPSLINFLEKLENKKIHYHLQKIRDSILIEVAIPGQRWEIEFMENGTIEIEKFFSDGHIFDHNETEVLFNDFAD